MEIALLEHNFLLGYIILGLGHYWCCYCWDAGDTRGRPSLACGDKHSKVYMK